MDLQDVRATTTEIALEAGRVLMNYYGRPHRESTKASVFDIVTEADTAVEAVIRPALLRAFPGHYVVGEEGGGSGAPPEQADYFWYVDPIDGTINFAHDLPLFAVSIALTDRNRVPLVGVVFNPVHQELFSAARGFGTTLNGQPLHVTATDDLTRSVLITGFSSTPGMGEANLGAWVRLTPLTRGLRRLGTAALDLCYVAAGRADGFWEPWLHPWDFMGGLLCVEEAGGVTSDYSGGTEKLYSGQQIVATNGHIHAELLSALAETS